MQKTQLIPSKSNCEKSNNNSYHTDPASTTDEHRATSKSEPPKPLSIVTKSLIHKHHIDNQDGILEPQGSQQPPQLASSASAQGPSRFESLPAEIRIKVYELLIWDILGKGKDPLKATSLAVGEDKEDAESLEDEVDLENEESLEIGEDEDEDEDEEKDKEQPEEGRVNAEEEAGGNKTEDDEGGEEEEHLKGKGATGEEEAKEQEKEDDNEDIIRCICGLHDEDEERYLIGCDGCQVWQHTDCMEVTEEPDNYFCEQCKPDQHKDLLAEVTRGERPREMKTNHGSANPARKNRGAIMRVNKTTYKEFKHTLQTFWKLSEVEINVHGHSSGGSNLFSLRLSARGCQIQPEALQNAIIKSVKIRIQVDPLQSLAGYTRWYGGGGSDAYLWHEFCHIKDRVSHIVQMLHSANRIGHLNIGPLPSYENSKPTFERFEYVLSNLVGITTASEVEVMPFWTRNFFERFPEARDNAKEARKKVGDSSELQGFMVLTWDDKRDHYMSREHRRRCEGAVNDSKNSYWTYPYMLRDCANPSTHG